MCLQPERVLRVGIDTQEMAGNGKKSENLCNLWFYLYLCSKIRCIMEKKRIALKKLLEAVEKEIIRKPDRKTLDHLSLLVGYQDWDSFQHALHGETSADENYK